MTNRTGDARCIRVSAALAAAVAVLTLGACSAEDDTSTADVRSSADAAVTSVQEQAEGAISSVQSIASSAAERAGDLFDEAKLDVFVAAFRTAYPQLSADRETQSIETIVTETCPLIDSGASDQDVNAKVKEVATNGSLEPDDEQTARIAQLVRVACG
ncbi:hypothetical protein OED52_05325 [Rhodococcus sp. Z13]|uniref:Uncharacterized protein n=1 Tax=Rhodococcus sacchari TaxID=2962047 RepID=A0ACD4DIS8_9NOCA|nr:hypothetical protein [Rhodococcus sp. Z13]UYP19974.1 hypothetical protein OED52_05325 [Rhodococcus sp. Z13]